MCAILYVALKRSLLRTVLFCFFNTPNYLFCRVLSLPPPTFFDDSSLFESVQQILVQASVIGYLPLCIDWQRQRMSFWSVRIKKFLIPQMEILFSTDFVRFICPNWNKYFLSLRGQFPPSNLRLASRGLV